MSTDQGSHDQTYEQCAIMWQRLGDWSTAFALGIVGAIEDAGSDTAVRLSNLRIQYQHTISTAIAHREAAAAAADVFAESVWRQAADEMSRMAFTLADEARTAADRLAAFESSVRSGLLNIGMVGPLADVYSVIDAIRDGDGNAAGEAVLALGLGAAIGAAIASGSGALGLSATFTALMGGVGGVGGALLAEELNRYVARPAFDWLGTYIPDGLWHSLESFTFGEGAARLDPTGSAYASMLLHRIDSTVQLADLGRLFDVAGSAQEGRETVALLNQLGRVFTPGAASLPNDATDDQIIAYAGGIAAVTDRVRGGIRISTAPPSISDARQDFGALLSLQLGNTITVRLADAAPDSAASLELYGLHRTDYERWLSDRSRMAQGADPSSLHFSDSYLQARSEFVRAVGLAHTAEVVTLDGVTTVRDLSARQNFAYEDRTLQTQVNVLGITPMAPMAKVLFGTNAADADLQGGSQDDRLYGRDGNDVLRGEGGNDWLEGGADNDVLYGDDGNDTLLGGAGNDTLEGGNGNDWLYGGAGLDTYEFSAGHGNDVVIDSDGQGVIRYDGATIAGASIGPDGVGRDERFTYTLIDKGDGTHDLLIQRNGTSDSITIRNWIEGGFGFETTEQEEAPEFDRQFHGDYRPPIVGVEVDLDVGPGDPGYNRYAWDRVEWIEGSPILQGGIHHPTHSDAIRGTAGSDQIFTYGGNDWVAGHEGDDHIEGGVGKDVISGGPGADRIYGGDGDDLISSSMFIGTRWALPPANQSYADYQPYEQHGWTVPGAEVFVGEERFGVWWQEPNEDLVNLGIARNTHDNDWVDAGAGNDNVWGSLVS